MSTDYYHYSGKHIDYESEQQRSTDSLLHSGGWSFRQVSAYTEANPLLVPNNTNVNLAIPNNVNDYVDGKYLQLPYDFDNSKFIFDSLGDVFLVNVRMKCKADAQAGHLDIKLESPSFLYNPLNAYTFSFIKGANQEHFFSPDLTLFVGQDIINNGVQIIGRASDCNVSVYDYSVMIVRLYCNRGN